MIDENSPVQQKLFDMEIENPSLSNLEGFFDRVREGGQSYKLDAIDGHKRDLLNEAQKRYMGLSEEQKRNPLDLLSVAVYVADRASEIAADGHTPGEGRSTGAYILSFLPLVGVYNLIFEDLREAGRSDKISGSYKEIRDKNLEAFLGFTKPINFVDGAAIFGIIKGTMGSKKSRGGSYGGGEGSGGPGGIPR